MIKLVGILNVTPDSFSDGGHFLDSGLAIAQARLLFLQGATIVDIGADSSRPSSKCVGPELEWRRLEPVISEVVKLGSVSVDTHNGVVAAKAIKAGVHMINDVSAGSDPALLKAVSNSSCKVVLMHSVCTAPHSFAHLNGGKDPLALIPLVDIVNKVRGALSQIVDRAFGLGVRAEQIVLDPGMGAFLSADPRVSFHLLSKFQELSSLGFPLMLGCSRKGFLREPGEVSVKDRDAASALAGFMVAQNSNFEEPAYIRVHNVKLQKSVLLTGTLENEHAKMPPVQ